jgi:DNA invertase Pin-like site-specific DNA recombinase
VFCILRFRGPATTLSAVAKFENDIRRERQRDGIEKVKERGVYKGRSAAVDCREVATLAGDGHGATAIARRLGISRATVYRYAGGGDLAGRAVASSSTCYE